MGRFSSEIIGKEQIRTMAGNFNPHLLTSLALFILFFKVLKPSEEGQRYCRFYPIEIVPHLAIIDSRTGERLDIREGFIEPKDMILLCMKRYEYGSVVANFFFFYDSGEVFGDELS